MEGYFVISKAKKFKSATSRLVIYLENLICEGYDLAIRVHFLRQVFFAENIQYSIFDSKNLMT
jgi:hypothetical protein